MALVSTAAESWPKRFPPKLLVTAASAAAGVLLRHAGPGRQEQVSSVLARATTGGTVNLATAQTLLGDGLARSPLTVAIFDSELHIVWANIATEEPRPGLPPQGRRGQRLAEVMQEIDADTIEESLRRVLATGEPVLDLVVTNRVGAWVILRRLRARLRLKSDSPPLPDLRGHRSRANKLEW